VSWITFIAPEVSGLPESAQHANIRASASTLPRSYVQPLSQPADRSFAMLDSVRRLLSLSAIVALGVLSGCSRQPTSAPEEPWVTEEHVMRAEAEVVGIRTSYAAYFKESQLTRIVEKRGTSRNEQAEYTFTGARLIGYRGEAITAEQSAVELSFDMKGALTSSPANVAAEEIAAVRNRAQLLRSLALARRSTMQHSESAAAPASASGSHP
jgi:hypothetical protein